MMINKTEFQDMLQKDLRGKKNTWLFLEYNINNKIVKLKIWNNWAQIFNVDGIDYSFGMPDLSRKDFIQRISDKLFDYKVL